MDMVKYLQETPWLYYFSSTLGCYDLEFEFIVRDEEHIIRLMENLYDAFPNKIRNYTYFSGPINWIETFLPKKKYMVK